MGLWRYGAMLTDLSWPAIEVWNLYRGRADCENRFKELKADFGLDSFVLRDFWATEATLGVSMLAYNLMSVFRWAWPNSSSACARQERSSSRRVIMIDFETAPSKVTTSHRAKRRAGCPAGTKRDGARLERASRFSHWRKSRDARNRPLTQPAAAAQAALAMRSRWAR